MDLDALKEAVRRFDQARELEADGIVIYGDSSIVAAARAVLDSEEADWCDVHSWPWPNSEHFDRCMVGTGRDEDCELVQVLVVRRRLLAEEKL